MKSFLEMAFLPNLKFRERLRYLELSMLPHERTRRRAIRMLLDAGYDYDPD